MAYGKRILTIIVTVCLSMGCMITAMADDSEHEEWTPIIPKPLGGEAVERLYEWNEDDDMSVQVRGLIHNQFMDEEDAQIKLIALDYAMIMTGIRQPQAILDDESVLVGVYYGEFNDSIIDKISIIGKYPVQTKYIRENQIAVYTYPNESLDKAAFQKNFDYLKRLCNIDIE